MYTLYLGFTDNYLLIMSEVEINSFYICSFLLLYIPYLCWLWALRFARLIEILYTSDGESFKDFNDTNSLLWYVY